MRKTKIRKPLLILLMSALTISTLSGCISIKIEKTPSKNSTTTESTIDSTTTDTAITTEATTNFDTTEDNKAVATNSSSESVIKAFWRSYSTVNSDLMTECFSKLSKTAADSIVNSNIENAEKLSSYTTIYPDLITISKNDTDAKKIVEENNFTEYSDAACYTVEVPMIQTIQNGTYNVKDTYEICTICIDNNWYIVTIDETNAEVMSDDYISSLSNTNIISETSTTENNTTESNTKANTSLSSIYADLNNRSFMIDNNIFTVGKSTFNDFVNANLIKEDDLVKKDNVINSDSESEYFSIELNDTYSITVYFANYTSSNESLNNCVLSDAYFSSLDYNPDGLNRVKFAFPLSLTEKDLVANSGKPTSDVRKYEETDYKSATYEYKQDSNKYFGSSGYTFTFVNDKLYDVDISYK